MQIPTANVASEGQMANGHHCFSQRREVTAAAAVAEMPDFPHEIAYLPLVPVSQIVAQSLTMPGAGPAAIQHEQAEL